MAPEPFLWASLRIRSAPLASLSPPQQQLGSNCGPPLTSSPVRATDGLEGLPSLHDLRQRHRHSGSQTFDLTSSIGWNMAALSGATLLHLGPS
eukprot:249284-Prymnesium_polylepis.1